MSFVHFLNQPKVINALDTPKIAKHTFTLFIITNAILRPIATLADKSASLKERKYSATREFLQQMMCLACHLTLAPTFEKLAFQVAKQFPRLRAEFGNFKTFQQIVKARKDNIEIRQNNRLIAAGLKKGTIVADKELPKVLTGLLTMGSSLGTILVLACIAPLINNYILGPALKAFNSHKNDKKAAPASPNPVSSQTQFSYPQYPQNTSPMNQIGSKSKQTNSPYTYQNATPYQTFSGSMPFRV